MDEQSQVKKRRRNRPASTPLAYSVDQFCEVQPGGRSTIYDEIKKGRLKARKLRGRTLILHEDAVKYLRNLPIQQNQVESEEPEAAAP